MSNMNLSSMIFQDSATATGNGEVLSVSGGISALAFEIYGTATASTVIFEGKLFDNWYSIQCVNLSNLSAANQTTGKSELWQVDLTGISQFRCRISEISGGNLTIKGHAVN